MEIVVVDAAVAAAAAKKPIGQNKDSFALIYLHIAIFNMDTRIRIRNHTH